MIHNRTNRGFVAVMSALAVWACAAPALADDTEIYLGSSSNAKSPNVLFIVDTSGSMDGVVEIEGEPYDDSVTYAGSCVTGHVYWSEDERRGRTDPPSCDTDRFIKKTAITCEDIKDSLASDSGMAIARAEQLRGRHHKRWRDLQENNHDDEVDCRGSRRDVYQFYSANYMNWYYSDLAPREMTRLQVVKDIAKDLVDSISGINIGLMRFDDYADGGYIDLPIGPISDVRDDFKDLLGHPTDDDYPPRGECDYGYEDGEDGYCPTSNTPLAETLYEAALYLRGEDAEFGDNSYPKHSAPAAFASGSTYDSPIDYSCQKTHIVYLTDGEPTSDEDADHEIANITGDWCHGNCLDEMAGFLYEEDQRSSLDGTNNVITHMVGFMDGDVDLMKAASRDGGGDFYQADGYRELKTALTTVFTNILSTTSTFTAPAISVNAFNRLEHLDQLYYALFKPNRDPVWRGNLKRYKFNAGQSRVEGIDGQPAIHASTGQFRDHAWSWWSANPDGNQVALGGAARELTLPRDTYTNVGGGTGLGALSEDNASITPEMLGLQPDQTAKRADLLRWIRGVDVNDVDGDGDTTDARQYIGDPLHGQPVLIAYGDSESNAQLTLFAATNEGYLHAIDTETGKELWAFMPKVLLENIGVQYDSPSTGSRIYGLDGSIALRVDADDNKYLYFGMRRGGSHYYALDVTNRDAPKLLWTINADQSDFAEMGQTWSTPTPTKIDIGGTAKPVLIFGGGYDPDQDSDWGPDDQGRAIFIVDAEDGSLIWSGGSAASSATLTETFAAMDYSIPSTLEVLDLNRDGLAEIMYVGDMGGQIWRFDIHNGKSDADLVDGGVIAKLSGSDASDNRRFYYPPDVALHNNKGRQFLSISIGSGWRAHPLDEIVQDRFYMIRDPNVFEPPLDESDNIAYVALDHGDLYDATSNTIGQGGTNADDARKLLYEERRGWYINLPHAGEKVLAQSQTINGEVVFTTYQPPSGTSTGCGPGLGTARSYVMSVFDATPVADRDDDGDEDADDRSKELKRGGIPPEPTVIVIDGEIHVLVATERLNMNFSNGRPVRMIYWREVDPIANSN